MNNITDLQSYTLKDTTVDKILDCIKNNNFEDISFRTMTEKGFQTGNIINYFSKELLKEILPFNGFDERCFHLHYIEYSDGGRQVNHNHIDTEEYSFIVYLNDSDGGTYFQEPINTKVVPEKGKVIIFKSSVYHGGLPSFKNKKVLVGSIDKKHYEGTHTFQAHSLFPKFVFQKNIGVDKELIDFCNNQDYVRMESDNGHFSNDFQILEKTPKDLDKTLLRKVRIFLDKGLNLNLHKHWPEITCSWIVRHGKNDFAHNHWHENSHFRCVNYISQEDNGHIWFENEAKSNITFPGFKFEYRDDNSFNCNNYKLNVKSGDLIMFPSHMLHNVEKNLKDTYRYSLAFNVFMKGSFGRDEYQLEIR